MMKFWPTSPGLDLTTPKAAQDRNPFDSLVQSSTSSRTASNGSIHAPHPLLTPTNFGPPPGSPFGPPSGSSTALPSSVTSDLTPLASPATTASPTTSLSIHAPVFNSFLPPANMSLSLPPHKVKNQKAVSQPPSAPGSTPSSSATSTRSASPSYSSSLGQIHVKLIEARGLNVSKTDARPYVVVQFEQNEFVSRDPIADGEREVKGLPRPAIGSRQSSMQNLPAMAQEKTAAMSALGAIGQKDQARRKGSGGSSGSAGSASSSTPNGHLAPNGSLSSGLFGRLSQNPVWKHEVSFDITSTSQSPPITLNVYDRSVEDDTENEGGTVTQGFLGTVQVRVGLVDGMVEDRWYKLHPFDSETVTGEMRVQISFEAYKTKRSLTPRDFEFMKLIGRGTFGKVFQVRKHDTKRIYAMKVLSKKEIVARKEVAHTIGERKILQRSLDCPFLVGLKFSFQTERDLYLVTDFKSGGELFWHLQKETRFSEERAKFYVAELILALEHLHKYDIVYRDLKPENILLDATGHIALCDFGLSKADLPSNELTTTFCGTTEYLAPEILLDEHGYNKIVDFWSLGVLLFEMCCGWSPFYAEETQQMYKNICFGKIRFPKGVICEDGKMFVKGLLNRNPKHRLGANRDAAELKEHPFFKNIDWVALSLKQVTPPFKPSVESDESTANFDPEFTEADIDDLVDLDGDSADAWLDEKDPSEDWMSQSFTSPALSSSMHTPNGPLGSDRRKGSASSRKSNGGGRPGIQITGIKTNGKKNNGRAPSRESVLSNSMQENFRGFTFSGGESVSVGVLSGRAAKEDANNRSGESGESGGEDEFEDFGKSVGRYAASVRRKGLGFTELG